MLLQLVAESLTSIVLSLIQLFGWTSLGSSFIGNEIDHRIKLPVSILIGSAVTAFLYASFSAFGKVELGLAVVMAILFASTLLYRHRAFSMFKELWSIYKEIFDRHALTFWIFCATAVLYGINAIAPPRDQDVLYYHLAHIHQIDMENSWVPIADYCYGFPFGWTFNYLPFEHVGLPQVANLLNMGLWLIFSPMLFALLRRYAPTSFALLLSGIIVCHPFVLKMSTAAFSDMYAIFVALPLAMFIADFPGLKRTQFGLFGFVAWIGTQSRYQSIAIGLAVTALPMFMALRKKITGREIMIYCGGTLGALILASPFYLFNFIAFANPVWPLDLPFHAKSESYANKVATVYTASMTGARDMNTMITGITSFVMSPETFPISISAISLIVVSLFWRHPFLIKIGIPVTGFLLLWVWAQPMLPQPRYVMYLSPLILVGWAMTLGIWIKSCPKIKVYLLTFFSMVVSAFLCFGLYYSADAFRYSITGDYNRYHEHTSFYDVFETINRTTPPDAKFLIILTGGQTYYLDRSHRRADPEQSGVIDWLNLQSPERLDEILEDEGFDYILYEDTHWESFIGGTNLVTLLRGSITRNFLSKEAEFHTQVNESRIRRLSHPTRVFLLKRTHDA
jgi:hypothetical protein